MYFDDILIFEAAGIGRGWGKLLRGLGLTAGETGWGQIFVPVSLSTKCNVNSACPRVTVYTYKRRVDGHFLSDPG